MKRPLRLLCLTVAALLGIGLLPAVLWGSAPPASATVAVAHGQGVTWAADPSAWLGDYVLDDGARAFCLDVAKRPPTGASIAYDSGEQSGWFGVDDSARLRYISWRWGASSDPLAAAAAQLAVWTITGLDGHDQAHYAQRANADAAAVLASANQMLEQANGAGGASRGATASVTLAVEGDRGTVRSEVLIDYLAGAALLAPEEAQAQYMLHGAHFPDGSRTAVHGNGIDLAIIPDQHGAVSRVSVDVEYAELPVGIDFRLGRNLDGGQDLLVSSPRPESAAASASVTAPSVLPFRPRVQTETDAAVAVPGVELRDRLHLDVHPGSATEGEWGVYRAGDGTILPIPVVIESVLWGPLAQRPAESAMVPAGTPKACSVELRVTSGPGDYVSRPCRLAQAGYYVWTDSIDPARTPAAQGASRLQAWQSPFGVAAEASLVAAPPPTVTTTATPSTLTEPGCVRDSLTVTGLPGVAPPMPVHVRLLGPLAALPPLESEPAGWAAYPVAGSATLALTGNGTFSTPCLPLEHPGHYYFVFDSPGTGAEPPGPTPPPTSVPKVATDADGALTIALDEREATPGELEAASGELEAPGERGAAASELVPAFHDHRVHASEAVELRAPVTPPTTMPPTTPSATHPAVAPPAPPGPPQATRLPLTGADQRASLATSITAVVAIMTGLAIVGFAFGRPRRRRPHR